jgi:hypothetical protein
MQAQTESSDQRIRSRKSVFTDFARERKTATVTMDLVRPFHGLLRSLLIDNNPDPLTSVLNRHQTQHVKTRERITLNYPFVVLCRGVTGRHARAHKAEGAIETAWRRRQDERYHATEPRMRLCLLHDGYCFENDEPQQQGQILVERGSGDLGNIKFVVKDGREQFFNNHVLGWWYVDAINNLVTDGEVEFTRDDFHGGAFSATLPGAVYHRVVAAIVRAPNYRKAH